MKPNKYGAGSGIGENFERAVNTHELADLGDPEAWGGTQAILFRIPALQTANYTRRSRQLVRVQVPQLAARQWLLIATYELAAPVPAGITIVSVVANVVVGVGQVSNGIPAQVFPQPNVQTPLSLASTATQGSTDLGHFTASALNVFLIATLHAVAPANPLDVKLFVGLTASPRAL